MSTHSRRAILAGIAAAPAVTVPAIAIAAAPDPIFAAIKHYKAAVKTRDTAQRRCWDFSTKGPLRHLPQDAPECLQAEEDHSNAIDAEFEALNDLLDTQPTSLAGFAALLDQLGIDQYAETEESDCDEEPLIIMALEREPNLMASLAATMRALVGGAVS
jgi:hypothetical protein